MHLFIRQAQHLDIPGMVRMNEIIAAFFISQLRVHPKAGTDWMRMPQGSRKPDAQILRYLLSGDRSHVNIAVQTRTAFNVRFDDDADVRLLRLSHLSIQICCSIGISATF